MSRFLELTLAASLIAAPVVSEGLGLGREATPDEIAIWDIDIRPDGTGLPEGSGDVFTGEEIYVENCAVCHGDFGEAVGRWPVLAGGRDSLTDERPVKTIGSYWPYLSTVYDYINRAMPFGNAQSLEPDQIYAITAYLLYMNDIVDDDFELSHENFTEVELPNAPNFYPDDRVETELAAFSVEPCMSDCKPSVEITARAAIVDVTPEETAAKAESMAAAEPEAAPEPEPTPAAPVIDAELASAGEKVFRKCKSCHQVGEGAKNKTGPLLNGIINHAAGAVEGYKYSKALAEQASAGLVWDEATLAAFLANPKATVSGTKMSFRGLKSDEDIAAVTEYLKTFAE